VADIGEGVAVVSTVISFPLKFMLAAFNLSVEG